MAKGLICLPFYLWPSESAREGKQKAINQEPGLLLLNGDPRKWLLAYRGLIADLQLGGLENDIFAGQGRDGANKLLQ